MKDGDWLFVFVIFIFFLFMTDGCKSPEDVAPTNTPTRREFPR